MFSTRLTRIGPGKSGHAVGVKEEHAFGELATASFLDRGVPSGACCACRKNENHDNERRCTSAHHGSNHRAPSPGPEWPSSHNTVRASRT